MKTRPIIDLTESPTYDLFGIAANREGLQALRDAIDRVLASGEPQGVPFHDGANWHRLNVTVADSADYEDDEEPCDCGCQKEFEAIEAEYR
jgi:hypothetical protein